MVDSWQIWEKSPDPGGLDRYPIKSFIIIGLLLLIFQGISEAIKNLAIFMDNGAQGNQAIRNSQEDNYDL